MVFHVSFYGNPATDVWQVILSAELDGEAFSALQLIATTYKISVTAVVTCERHGG